MEPQNKLLLKAQKQEILVELKEIWVRFAEKRRAVYDLEANTTLSVSTSMLDRLTSVMANFHDNFLPRMRSPDKDLLPIEKLLKDRVNKRGNMMRRKKDAENSRRSNVTIKIAVGCCLN